MYMYVRSDRLTESNCFGLQGQENFHVENACAYIDQLDKHAARLTVAETFEFAFQCQSGRPEVRRLNFEDTEEAKEYFDRAEKEHVRLNVVASFLGLSHVKDTFVGDEEIRGVSGGQRRRVTVGEMIMSRTPVLCGDEISTGLDATSTYDMVQVLLHFGKAQKMTRVFALLQPGPDTVSLFDDVILLAEGKILFAGPIEEVEDYFAEIGYQCPQFMDVADFLQMVSTEDGATLYDPPAHVKEIRPNPPTISELADLYRDSPFATKVKFDLASENEYVWNHADPGSYTKSVSEVGELPELQKKYANNFLRSSSLILNRFLTLWIRDKRVIFAGAAKNILMGVSVGGVFLNADDVISIQGALFQTGLFIMLGMCCLIVSGMYGCMYLTTCLLTASLFLY
jgi:ABC-type multidrug transport system ATPase subunit